MTSPVIQFKRGNFVNLPPLEAGEPALTLDTFEFYIGINSTSEGNKFFGSHRYWTRESSSTGSGVNLVEGTANGLNYLTLKSPDSLAGITTYTFPATPENGYFLKTNADGTLEWASVSAGASFSGATLDNTSFSGISTFTGHVQITDDTQSTDKDTGALIVEGGVGIEKNLNVGGDLKVTGVSTFVGSVTFEGGTINLGDSSSDNINVTGEFISDLIPNDDDAYDVGIGTQRWRNANFSGVSRFNNVTVGGATTALIVEGNTRIIGILTIGSASVTFSGVNNEIAGITTFTGFADLTEGVNVDGHTELDNVNVSGVTTTGTLRLNGTSGIGITAISVDTGLVEDSDDYLATQKAVKAYVDAQVTAANLDFGGDSGTGSVDLDSESLTIAGTANEIVTSGAGTTLTIGLPNDVTVTTSLTTPTVKATDIQANDGTSSITISNGNGNVGISSNLTVSGNLFVNGSTTQVNTTTLTVEDTLVEIGLVDGNAPNSDVNIDLGILFNYYTSSAKKAAVYWDDSAERIAIASEVTEVNSVLTANAYAALEIGALWVNDCAGQSQVISCAAGVRTLQNITIDAGTF
jgi:hypothetical protein